MRHRLSILVGLALSLGVGAGLTGCSGSSQEAQQAGPPTVTVSYPLQRKTTDYEDYTGRTAAVDSVQVRARVTGYLQQINFKEGVEVKEGDVLCVIDPRPYQATVDQAKAQLRLQQAQLRYQEAVYQRNVVLAGKQAVTPEELEQSVSQRDVARAQVNAAKANLAQAELNLGWTRVLAPISGLISRRLVTRGNLIVADQTLLTTIVSQDPMYAYFDADEPTVLRVQALIRAGKLKSVRERGVRIPVLLGLTGEQDFPHKGYVDFVNNQLNPSTATLQIRGTFANPKPPRGPRLLSPGLFVRVRVPVSPPYEALLVTQSAVGTDQDLNYAYVLDAHNKVSRREVELGTEHEGLVVIARGLNPEDRVVVNGLQHARPGAVVNPKLVPMPIPRPSAQRPTAPARVRPAAAGPAQAPASRQAKR
jgi:multidrug efflux system membrane fusion protein